MIRPSSSMGMFFAPWTITTEQAQNEYTIDHEALEGVFLPPRKALTFKVSLSHFSTIKCFKCKMT
jgi:hypothetical protein